MTKAQEDGLTRLADFSGLGSDKYMEVDKTSDGRLKGTQQERKEARLCDLITTSSSERRYQCRSALKCCRLRTGYITSCPGPWKVTSPPRSVLKMGRGGCSGSNLRCFSVLPAPRVNTCSFLASKCSLLGFICEVDLWRSEVGGGLCAFQ